MKTWIEVEDATGRRLGALLHATDWQYQAVRNGAGSFSFRLPVGANDDLLQQFRVVRCYQQGTGTPLRELGAGIIETIAHNDSDPPMWQVTGGDLLRELTHRVIDELDLSEQHVEHPAECYSIKILTGTERRDLLKMLDWQPGDMTTYAEFPGDGHPMSATDGNRGYIYVRHARQFHGVRLTILSEPSIYTNNGCTLAAEYWGNGEWQSLSLADGTIRNVNGHLCTLAQSGDVRWSLPSNWQIAPGEATYQMRLYVSDGHAGPPLQISDCAVLYDGPTNDALLPIMAYAPAGWSLDAEHGYTQIRGARTTGPELIVNGGFETRQVGSGPFNPEAATLVSEDLKDVGLPASGSFAWSIVAPTNTRVEWTAAAHGGSTALKLVTLRAVTAAAYVEQVVAVQPGKAHRLTFWTHSGGTAEGSWQIWARIGDNWQALTNVQDTGLTVTDWTQVAIMFTTPNDCSAIAVRLYGARSAGTVYIDDVSLCTYSGGEVHLPLRNETVLGALVRVAEQSGEAFTKSPSGRQVLWLGHDRRVAATRAIGPLVGLSAPSLARNCRITTFNKVQNAYDLVTRVRPVGAGFGVDRLTLSATTRSAPPGFALAGSWLVNAELEALSGRRIEKLLEYPDIAIANDSQTQREFAANQLFDRALEHLYNHRATDLNPVSGDMPSLYTLTLVSVPEPIVPGWLLRVIWSRRAGDRWRSWLDGALWVQSVSVAVATDGATTYTVQVSTVPQSPAPNSDAALVAAELRKARQARAYGGSA